MDRIRFAVDRGGTFTDVYAECGEAFYVEKLLSEDPDNYADAPREGIRRILERITGDRVDPDAVPTERIASIRMGTTVATNALLERRGARTALLITKGFADALRIGYQDRPELFALDVRTPEPLYERVLEVDERVIPSGDSFRVLKIPDAELLRVQLEALKKEGIESIAIVLMHAYGFFGHELLIERIAEAVGFECVVASHRAATVPRLVERGDTAVVDAYLTPHIRRYVESFKSGFSGGFEQTELLFMQSNGGLCDAEGFRGANAILSGPAGGVVGYASDYEERALIGFDMGGTSTDVSRFEGAFEVREGGAVKGVRLQTPQLDIKTVAAGGGSRLFYRNGMFAVGPESAGAHPGPVCYRKGGPLSLTDANLVLGRIRVEDFPAIFGPDEDRPLDLEASRKAFEALAVRINATRPTPMSVEEIALGFVRVANDSMVKPIRELSVEKGFDVRTHALACFGGAGAQHACALARLLGISDVRIHRHGGILSAYGIGMAEVVESARQSVHVTYGPGNLRELEKRLEAMAAAMPSAPGARVERSLSLHFEGSECSFEIPEPADRDYRAVFEARHRSHFGFVPRHAELVVDALIVVVRLPTQKLRRLEVGAGSPDRRIESVPVYFEEGWREVPRYETEALGEGDACEGPCLLVAPTTSIVVEPGCRACIDAYGGIRILVDEAAPPSIGPAFDPVAVSIFGNLFMSIAEQMGRTLQNTAVSTNIKERLDFSCAVFDAEGNLIANAPHIPVHLGSISQSVRAVLSRFEGRIEPGDVFITNAPHEGGSHLPDITVISPHVEAGRVRYVVANRGHHADVGGLTPGSMPPFSHRIEEEGALIESFKILEQGRFAEGALRRLLSHAGARRIEENIADVKAQTAANRKGIALMQEAVGRYGAQSVEAYMGHLQRVAFDSIRNLMRTVAQRHGETLDAADRMDDGGRIGLRIGIDASGGEAVFDFSDCAPQSYSNQNAPVSVVHSAVVYALRCLINEPLPLNEGFLKAVRIVLAEQTLLNPDAHAAVVGGNVTTSQRIVDVVLRAFGVCAASSGCMNNFSFGDEHFGYYETIAGGAGATATSPGADAVHTHMTNTRITDAEVLERRYPVRLHRFAIRQGSGGGGTHRGGDGVVRELEFLKPVQASVLSERRVFAPWGQAGGSDGAVGVNTLIRDGRRFDLGGKVSLAVRPGDRIRIETPGGGGYGPTET